VVNDDRRYVDFRIVRSVMAGATVGSVGVWLSNWIASGQPQFPVAPLLLTLWGIMEGVRWWRTPVVRKDEEADQERWEPWPPEK
jgi:hypothetical protein